MEATSSLLYSQVNQIQNPGQNIVLSQWGTARPYPNHKLEYHPLSAGQNLKTRYALVTQTPDLFKAFNLVFYRQPRLGYLPNTQPDYPLSQWACLV